MRLTAETDQEAVTAHVAGQSKRAALRTARARADRLQRNARIRTGGWDLEIAIEAAHPPARIESGGAGPTIVISGDAVAQPTSAFAPREWDLLVQTVWVMHEVGHLDHSDFDDLQRRLQDVPEVWRPVAGQLWNAFEDGAVEAAIRDRWPNYGRWFDLVRENLLAGTGPGIVDPAGGRVYPMVHAIVLGVIDATHPASGTFDALLDPTIESHHFATDADRERFETDVRPEVAAAVEDVMSMPEAVDRNRRISEFVEAVRPSIDAARADGRAQIQALESGAWGMPDDAGHATWSGEAAPISALEQGAPRPEASRTQAASETRVHRPGETDVQSAERAKAEPDADRDLEHPLAEAVAEQQRRDSADRDSRVASLEGLQAAVAAAGTELESDGVLVPTDEPVPDEQTVAAAREDGARLAQVLRNRFQKRRKRSIERHTRRGRLDPSALHRHATGEKRVKFRHRRPDETEHFCLFVIDRSGSMREHIRVAERAMGMLVFALESVEVSVEVLELLDKELRLAKSPDQAAMETTPRLFHGDATGGTPLTDTLHIARERLKRERGKRFVFVVTDGRPSDPERYREALNRFSNPVVGVNLTTDEAAGTSEFHRQVTVPPDVAELRAALRQLVQEVLFE